MAYAISLPPSAAHPHRAHDRHAENDAVRVMRGVLVGGGLSVPLWAAIALVLHATLG